MVRNGRQYLKTLVLSITGVMVVCLSWAQDAGSSISEDSLADSTAFSNSFFAVPLVFRSPETSWGFGAGAIYAFKPKRYSQTTRPSQVQIGFAYTVLDQILSYAPFQIFTNDNKMQFSGELGYYRFTYDYYGIGNSMPPDFREVFTVEFPRLRFQAAYQIFPNQYFGLRYWMDNFDITDTEPGGELNDGGIRGSQGGFLSGLGIVYSYDNRDNVFDAHSGWFIETAFFHNGSWLGSSFDYGKFIMDARKYFTVGKKQALATQVYLEFTGGRAPFNQLALMGGTQRMRGYYEGRFRDNNLIMTQSEYRFPIFWRIRGVVFGGLGVVSDRLVNLSTKYIRWTAGGGLRFAIDPVERINIRLDYGIAAESSGFYITVSEAF